MRHAIIIISLWLSFFPVSSAHAENWQDLDVARRYNLFLGGVQVGYMVAEIRQDTKGIYRFELKIESKGLLAWISQYRSTTVARFKIEQGKVIPLSFISDGALRGKPRTTRLEYNTKGKIIREVLTPPKKTEKHKPVPEQLLVGAQNPLTGAVASREHLKQFVESGSARTGQFAVSVYDGKRLGKYHFNVLGNSTISLKNKPMQVVGIKLSRSFIAGFSDSDIEDLEKEPVITIYFPKDARLLPIKAEASIPFGGHAVVLFDRECASVQSCIEPK